MTTPETRDLQIELEATRNGVKVPVTIIVKYPKGHGFSALATAQRSLQGEGVYAELLQMLANEGDPETLAVMGGLDQ